MPELTGCSVACQEFPCHPFLHQPCPSLAKQGCSSLCSPGSPHSCGLVALGLITLDRELDCLLCFLRHDLLGLWRSPATLCGLAPLVRNLWDLALCLLACGLLECEDDWFQKGTFLTVFVLFPVSFRRCSLSSSSLARGL